MTTKHRPSFIGRDPAYTGPPPALRRAAQPADDPAPPPEALTADEPVGPSPQRVATPRPPRSQGPSRPRPEAPLAPDGACRLNVQIRLGESATTRLEALARDSGESPEQVLRYLRKDAARALRALLATDARPSYPRPPRVGAAVRVQLSLQGEDYRRARQWLDPLGIGDQVLRDRLRFVLAGLLQDRIDALADGREGKEEASPR